MEKQAFLIATAEEFDKAEDVQPETPSTDSERNDSPEINAFWSRCGKPKTIDD